MPVPVGDTLIQPVAGPLLGKASPGNSIDPDGVWQSCNVQLATDGTSLPHIVAPAVSALNPEWVTQSEASGRGR